MAVNNKELFKALDKHMPDHVRRVCFVAAFVLLLHHFPSFVVFGIIGQGQKIYI
jgi:hypothetical protein